MYVSDKAAGCCKVDTGEGNKQWIEPGSMVRALLLHSPSSTHFALISGDNIIS